MGLGSRSSTPHSWLTTDAGCDRSALERDGLQEVRGQTGEGVLLCPGQRNSKWSPPLSALMLFAAGGLAAVGAALGLQQQNRIAHLAAAAPARSYKRGTPLPVPVCVGGQCVQACPYDTLKLATLASGLSAGTPYLSHGIFLAKCVRTFRAPAPKRCAGS